MNSWINVAKLFKLGFDNISKTKTQVKYALKARIKPGILPILNPKRWPLHMLGVTILYDYLSFYHRAQFASLNEESPQQLYSVYLYSAVVRATEVRGH